MNDNDPEVKGKVIQAWYLDYTKEMIIYHKTNNMLVAVKTAFTG